MEVIEPGLLTTVQDRGRPDAVHLGVPIGGACDERSFALANHLVGNDLGAAALEITLAGPTLRLVADCVVAIAGADFEAQVEESGERLAPASSRRLRRGETLVLGTPREGSGIRAYVALPGGVDVAEILGSRSTCLVGGFGGFDGRSLRAGDVVRAAGASAGSDGLATSAVDRQIPRRLRAVAGPVGGGVALDQLLEGQWTVSIHSDRQGLRLDGPQVRLPDTASEMLSHGVAWGAIQVPPGGQPICLLADHQTVGGYPVVAVVASVDQWALGQLGPGDEISFELIEVDEAQRMARLETARWQAALAALTRAR
jgi:biotin-dependent carboxylase-like uncharacterized protein